MLTIILKKDKWTIFNLTFLPFWCLRFVHGRKGLGNFKCNFFREKAEIFIYLLCSKKVGIERLKKSFTMPMFWQIPNYKP